MTKRVLLALVFAFATSNLTGLFDSGAPPAVAEPTALLLFGMGALTFARRLRLVPGSIDET